MRRIVATAVLLLAVSALAQPAPPPPRRGPDPLLASLNLTADQKAKWEAAHADFVKATQPLHDQIKAAHDALDDKLGALLTPEQKAKFDAARAERRDRHEPPPPPCPMP